jgi:hypothetical protein
MKLFGIVLFVCPLMAQLDTAGISPLSLTGSSLIETQPAVTSNPLAAAGYLNNPHNPPKGDGKTLYRWSLAAVTVGNAADTFSSWHHPEANPFLANPGSNFDARFMALKAALLGASFLIERWALHYNPHLYRPFAWLNFTIGGVLGGVAAHNTTLH